jgi:20S proteasome alpha/beta subunit
MTVTSGSVVGLRFKDGVMIGTDTICSRGSKAKFKNI